MRALGARLGAAYRARFIGQTLPVLWERQDADGRWRGLTDTYLTVVTALDVDLYNRITPARLVAVQDEVLIGEVVE